MLKPLHDHIIVRPIKEEEKRASGIILPDTLDKEKPEKGEIIAVGDGKILENGQKVPMDVKVGDQVLFTKYSPNEVKIDGEEYLVLRESDVLAIIEDTEHGTQNMVHEAQNNNQLESRDNNEQIDNLNADFSAPYDAGRNDKGVGESQNNQSANSPANGVPSTRDNDQFEAQNPNQGAQGVEEDFNNFPKEEPNRGEDGMNQPPSFL